MAHSRLNARYLAVDGDEPVLYRARSADGEQTPFVVYAVLYELTRREQSPSGGGWITVTETVWEIDSQELKTVRPEEGDVIEQQDGQRYSVLEVRKIAFDTVYQLPVTKERAGAIP